MNIEQNRIDDLNLKVVLKIEKEDYAEEERKKLNERKRTAEFKGFRKGMVPMQLIQRVYGEQALVEAVNKVISEGLNGFIKENNLKTIGEPLTSEDQPEVEWKSGNAFEFHFDIAGTKPLNLEIGKDDKLPYYEITVTKAAKDEMKTNLLRQFGSLQEGEAAGEQDYVIADLTQGETKVEGAYIAVRNAAGDAHKSFLGAKAGDSFDVNVNDAFTDEADRAALLHVKREELAGIEPVWNVKIVNVKTFVPAEENQDSYDKIYGPDKVHNSEEFDKAVEEKLADNYKQEADYQFGKDLKKALLAKAGIQLPEEYLKRWLFQINEGKFTKEQIEKEFPAFAEDYRWQMVTGYLMDKFGLKVEPKEVEDAAMGYVAYQYAMYGMGNVPENMLKDAAKNVLADENQSRRLYESVEESKVTAAVKENITLESKKISVEKFRELK